VAGDMDLDLIYKDKILGTMERKTLTSGKKKVWENRYQWFLFPCLVLLLIEFILSSKKKLKGLLIFVFVFGISILAVQNKPVYAQTVSSSVKQGIQAFDAQNYEQAKKHFIDAQLENPENAKLYYNIGVAAYMNEEYDQAKKNFMQAARTDDINLRHDAQYNLANTAYRMGEFDEAIKGYENILKEFPEDGQAKENLAFVKQKKQEKQEQESKCDKDNKEKKEDQEKKEDKENKESQNSERDKEKDQEKGRENNPDEDPDNKNSSQNKNKSKEQKQQNEPVPENNQEDKNANQNMENMLNRLEDKPGRAMIPVLQEQDVEKDC